MRSGELIAIDAANIAEEIESIGRRDRREMRNRLITLLSHLLQWRVQAAARSARWACILRAQRLHIQLILEDSPSLRPMAAAMLIQAYEIARLRAIAKTGFADELFPMVCPFTADEVLAPTFLPEA